MKKVTIITVNYNQPVLTEALLKSIHNSDNHTPFEIVVVDNGSSVVLPAMEKKYPDVKFIRSETNLGFAGGNNLGVKAATGDYLFLVNNDTEFTPGLVDKLVDTLNDNPEVGIISPKIRYYDRPDILQYAGFTRMNYYTARNSCIGQHETDNGQYDRHTGETGFIHGAAMMVRKEALEKAGLMSEIYFLYYEEMDWCERIRKAGYQVWVDNRALIYHKESVSVGANSPLKEYFMNRNRILFVRRNGPLHKRLAFWPYFLFVVATRNTISYIRKNRWDFVPILFKAILWNLKNDVNCPDTGYALNN